MALQSAESTAPPQGAADPEDLRQARLRTHRTVPNSSTAKAMA